jgi:hypothetical protein
VNKEEISRNTKGKARNRNLSRKKEEVRRKEVTLSTSLVDDF